MIENKLQFYQTRAGYDAQKQAGNIPDDALIFIKETHDIITHGEEGFGNGSNIDRKIADAINNLDSSVSKSAGADGLALSLTETNGKITSIDGSIAENVYDAYGSASIVQTEIVDGATSEGDTLKKLENRISPLEIAVGSGGDIDSRITTAKNDIIGDATTDYNTLGKVENKLNEESSTRETSYETISGRVGILEEEIGEGGSIDSRITAETERAINAESVLDSSKADKATTLAGYNIIDAYSKNETYNKEEVDNIAAAYTSQKYVTVEATEQTTSVTDVLPSSGQATDTVYRVAKWDGSTYNTAYYAEYTWNGSAYILMDVKNVGIDNDPIEGSNNLVKSGGVYNIAGGIMPLSGAKRNKTSEFLFIDNKRVNYTTGNIQNAADLYSANENYIDIEGYDKLLISIPVDENGKGASGYAFYASDQSYISGGKIRKRESESDTYEIRTINVPSDAKYFRTTWLLSSDVNYNVFSMYGIIDGETPLKIDAIDNEIETLEDFVGTVENMSGAKKDISDLFSFDDGYRINRINGKLQNDPTPTGIEESATTQYVNIEGFTHLLISMKKGNPKAASGLAFYTGSGDWESDFISGVHEVEDASTEETYKLILIPIPDNAKYVRTTWWATISESYAPFSCYGITTGYLQEEIEDINDSITKINDDISEIREELENNDVALPDYYFENNYINNRIDDITTLIENRSINGDVFFWFTDPHSYNIPSLNPINGLNTPKLIDYIKERINIKKVFCGGDLIGNGGGDEKADTIKGLQLFRKYCNSIWDNMNVIVGNHEWNNANGSQEYMDKMLPISLIYELIIKDKEHEIKGVDALGDYYIDNPVQKIRYFFIGCEYNAAISTSRVAWLAQQLLEVPSGYTVVVLSHVAIKTNGSQFITYFQPIANVLDAAKANTEITVDGTSYDYSSFEGIVACVISGHNHIDASLYTTGGIPVISTTCDRLPTASSSEGMKAARVAGTITEQAVDVYLIDTDARKINTVRIGGSYDYSTDAPLENPDREFLY